MAKPRFYKHRAPSIRKPAAVAPKARPVTLTSLAGTVIHAPNFRPTRIGIKLLKALQG